MILPLFFMFMLYMLAINKTELKAVGESDPWFVFLALVVIVFVGIFELAFTIKRWTTQ